MYAKGIQDAIRPDPEIIKAGFSDYFILSQARDIVNGDFYWLANVDENILLLRLWTVPAMVCLGRL